jgi:hypothetical protein
MQEDAPALLLVTSTDPTAAARSNQEHFIGESRTIRRLYMEQSERLPAPVGEDVAEGVGGDLHVAGERML